MSHCCVNCRSSGPPRYVHVKWSWATRLRRVSCIHLLCQAVSGHEPVHSPGTREPGHVHRCSPGPLHSAGPPACSQQQQHRSRSPGAFEGKSRAAASRVPGSPPQQPSFAEGQQAPLNRRGLDSSWVFRNKTELPLFSLTPVLQTNLKSSLFSSYYILDSSSANIKK